MNFDFDIEKFVPYVKYHTWLRDGWPLVIRRPSKKGYKILKPNKWWVNATTPVGDDAIIYERKPYDGNREIGYKEILGQIKIDEDIY